MTVPSPDSTRVDDDTSSTPPRSMRERVRYLATGFAMGSADVIPGVSGGTIALILGVYERLIHAIGEAAHGGGEIVLLRFAKGFTRIRRVEWGFIAPLLVGILLAVVSMLNVVLWLLDTYETYTKAAFFGLVAASLYVPWHRIAKPTRVHYGLAALAAVTAFVLLGFAEIERTSAPLWGYFLSGAVAICAMILPGVSGAYLLTIMGMYELVAEAAKERRVTEVAAFLFGAVIGLGLFSQFLNWALERHHDVTMALLAGLMLGSLRALWPWQADGSLESAPTAQQGLACLFIALAAAGAVTILIAVGRRHETAEAAG
jgi:putative membrane protein